MSIITAGIYENTGFSRIFIEKKVFYIPYEKLEIPSHIMLNFSKKSILKEKFRNCGLAFAKYRNKRRNEGLDIGYAKIYITKENLDQGFLCIIDTGNLINNYNIELSKNIDILYESLVKEGYCNK